MENFRDIEMKEEAPNGNLDAFKEECNKIKDATQDKQKIFHKREGTGGISGQLYEIYLVLSILLRGLTNKNITQFHLASNLKEAGDFDDVVISYSCKDLNGTENVKVTFIQAKHKEKTKNISLEELLGKTGKGGFDLKKYFKSFRSIKKHFEGDNPTHPIFGRDFNECEFIIYTNSLFKCGHTEKVYINESYTEEESILNFNGERIKYQQLRFTGKENDRITIFLANAGESEVPDFKEFLSKLKICSAQPNQDQLMEIIKDKIQSYYSVTRSDIETVFPVVKNKVETWWKNACEYITEKNTFIQNATRLSIKFEVQDPVHGFTGREQSLRDLHESLLSGGQSVISQSASVTGLGGIGKTELARKYISQYSQHYDNNVIWINAETYETCSESFRRLAGDALEIGIKNKDGKDKDINSIKSEVFAFFARRDRKCLFIFDNAENLQDSAPRMEEEHVKNFLPSGENKTYVLITSRNQHWWGMKSLNLDLFTEEESAQFIEIYLSERQIKLEETQIKKLGELLQYLPLALRQAVAYIAMENERLMKWNESYTVENYLNEFEDKANELLGKAPKDIYDSYAKTVLTTWQVTIKKIKENEKYGMQSSLILHSISFLAPDNIPIVTIYESLMNKEIVRGCIEILEQYSLVKIQDGMVSIHRLLQQVIRVLLSNEKKEEEIMEITLNLFKSDISSNCIIHIRTLWDYAKNVNKIVQNFCWVPQLIINKLIDAIKYNDAYSFGMKTHKLFKDVLGDIHQATLFMLHAIAFILDRLGKYNDALIVYQEVLCKQKENLGSDHPDMLRTMYSLASVLDTQGKYEESLVIYQNVLRKLKETVGPDHIYTLSTMHNLAVIVDNQGKYEESLTLYREVLYKQKNILGLDHPFVLTTMQNLASVLRKLGKYEESFILHQEILCKRKEILGQHHPNTLSTMHNLALILYIQGNCEKAIILYKEVLCKRKEILGPNHPHTLITMNNLAVALSKLGKKEESLNLFEEVLSKRKEIFGPDHPDTLSTRDNMAFVSSTNKNKFQRFLKKIFSK